MNKAKPEVLWSLLDDAKPQATPAPLPSDPVATLWDSVPGLMPGESVPKPSEAPSAPAPPDLAPILARYKAAYDAWAILEIQAQILRGKLVEVKAEAEALDIKVREGRQWLGRFRAQRPMPTTRIAKGEAYCADLDARARELGDTLNKLRADIVAMEEQERIPLGAMDLAEDEALKAAGATERNAYVCPQCLTIVQKGNREQHSAVCWAMETQKTEEAKP